MGRKGRRRSKKGTNAAYVKVLTTFKCSNGDCMKKWVSVHGCEINEKDNCEYCGASAKLMEAKDGMLEVDTYTCPKGCGGWWQSLHYGKKGVPQECDCGEMVDPAERPQKRFARHYVFICKNKKCSVNPEWEDFSTAQQKTQICTKCKNKGEIQGIQQLKQRKDQDGEAEGDDDDNDNAVEPPMGKGRHNSECCEMCQFVIRQGYRSCHSYQRITTKEKRSTVTGAITQKIVAAVIMHST